MHVLARLVQAEAQQGLDAEGREVSWTFAWGHRMINTVYPACEYAPSNPHVVPGCKSRAYRAGTAAA